MKIYTYPWYFKIFYRFGNLPLTFLLVFYLIIFLNRLGDHLVFFLPSIITLGLIYLLNRHFLILYKVLPMNIELCEEKLVASGFLFSSRKMEIRFDEISELSGGLFDGKTRGVMKIYDNSNKSYFGYYNTIRNYQELGTTILSKVRKDIYESVLNRIGLIKNKKNKPS